MRKRAKKPKRVVVKTIFLFIFVVVILIILEFFALLAHREYTKKKISKIEREIIILDRTAPEDYYQSARQKLIERKKEFENQLESNLLHNLAENIKE